MEIIEVTSTSYPDAVPLPNKPGRPAGKRQKASSNTSGSRSARRCSYLPRLSGKLLADQQKADQLITRENKKMLLLSADGKLRFVSMGSHAVR